MRARRWGVAAIAVAMLALTGCTGAGGENGAPGPTTSTPPTSTPTTVPIPEPAGDPVLAFGGDCANVLTQAQVVAVLDDPDASGPVIADLRGGALGGLWCTASSAVGGEFLSVGVYPLDAVPRRFVDDYAGGCEDYDGSCFVGRVTDGAWVFVAHFQFDDTREEILATLGAVADDIAARIGDYPEPAAGISDGTWWTGVDCTTLAAAVDVDTLIGAEATVEEGYPIDSNWAFPAWGIPVEAGAHSLCWWHGFGDGPFRFALFDVYPGAGAMWGMWRDFSGAAAVEVEVPGAVDAFEIGGIISKHLGRAVVLTDGVNVLVVEGATAEFALDAAARAVEFLSGP